MVAGSVAEFDVVIRNGRVVDGTGSESRIADVAIKGSTIVAVEPNLPGTGEREIDATGLLVTPGWVDHHTHYDGQVSWDKWLTPSSWHGVTTAVMGNCGVGFAPARPDSHEWLIQLMEGVEDIPGSALTEGLTWGWETYPEYLDKIASLPKVMDIGSQVTHGPLRAYVMEERAGDDLAATEEDLQEMARLVAEGMEAGALGFSTSRTQIHRGSDGELVPGTDAPAHELMVLGEAMSRGGTGVFQFATDHPTLVTREWAWMRELAEKTQRPVMVSMNQSLLAPDVWKEVLPLLESAHADGLEIYAQVAGRGIGVVLCLEGSAHPLMISPAFWDVANLPRAELAVALNQPEMRERLKSEPLLGAEVHPLAALGTQYDRMYLMAGDDIDYEPTQETSVASVAEATGRHPIDVIVDELTATEGQGMLYLPIFNYAYGDLSMTHEMQQHDFTRMGLADGGAHCGAICDGGMPTFMLTHWTRDRSRGPRLDLEWVVYRQTKQAAEVYGLLDRGVLAPGYRADINVIDYENLTFDRPSVAYDLPAGGRRLVQRAQGYKATFCGGVQTVADDEFTGELPGQLIRGAQSAPKGV